MINRDKVLVIDDSPVQTDRLRSILEADYDITLANTAEEGLRHAKEGGYALILLDVVMPEMDGFALLKKLQSETVTQHTPVIMVTSLDDVDNEERGLTLGAVDYITKPYHPPIVRARVNTHIKLFRYREQVEQKAMIDPMTSVANRRGYDNCYYRIWQDAARLKTPISLCMMDIDNFKVYNDTFGHPAGDKVIRSVAGVVSEHLRRSTDFVARYGGEEFVAIIQGGDANEAFTQMKHLHQAVENLHIPHNPKVSQWVTISIGGVTVHPKIGDSYDTYLKIADTMLYDAKRFGRNQVVWTNERMEQLRG